MNLRPDLARHISATFACRLNVLLLQTTVLDSPSLPQNHPFCNQTSLFIIHLREWLLTHPFPMAAIRSRLTRLAP